MAQHDYVIANGTGAAVRSDINGALAAIVSQNSGTTTPATTYAYQFWADTTTGLLKIRNAANSAWITLFQLDGEWSTLAMENGTAAAPSIYFKDSGTDTGFYSPGADQVGISTGGVVRLTTSTTAFTGTLPWLGQNGTAAAPALSFSGDPNTGIYNVGADQLGISTNGTLRLTTSTTAITSTLPVVVPLGAVATPSFTFSGDLDTGIWSPTANTLAFSEGGVEAARIDSSARLLIGATSTISTKYDTSAFDPIFQAATTAGTSGFYRYGANTDGSALVLSKSRNATIGSHTIVNADDTVGYLGFAGSDGAAFITAATIRAAVDGTPGANDMPGRLVFATTADGASSPTERMRITNSGNLQVGTTSGTARLNLLAGAQVAATITNTNTDDLIAVKGNSGGSSGSGVYVMPMRFGDDTLRGSIYWNGSTVAYNTTSDYRLKENINTYTDALDKLANLKPVTYTFTDNPNVVLEGFIAHEVQDVVPNAVSGVKDEVDPKGNPLYQGLDTAKLVPLLTAALQEAVAKIESLEARLTAAGI